MKFAIIINLYILLILPACNNDKNNNGAIQNTNQASFFPVTSYIKGQIIEIKNRGITPLKYTTINNHTDSVWLKTEELDTAFHEFLTPVIDSTNLTAYFKETKFFDQTINAFTFTYDPEKALPGTFNLVHWDIYVDPDQNKVTKIYLVKNYPGDILIQLTWYSDKYCKMTTITKNNSGTSIVTKEEKIKWDF